MNDKLILDACCGGRMFWFNKKHPNTIYIDNEPRARGQNGDYSIQPCNPDIVMDFTDLQFPDSSFNLVVWDPPHIRNLGNTSIMRKKYGALNAETWPYDLKHGFSECWRVLKDYGVLVFKWNEEDIPVKKILSLFKKEPLFGHPSGSKSKTHWFCFMKIPEKKSDIER